MELTVTLIGDGCRVHVRMRDAAFEVDAAGIEQLVWALADARRQMQPPLLREPMTAARFREDPGTGVAVSTEADGTHIAIAHPGLGAIGVRLSTDETAWLVERLTGKAE
jgi:hypothetical protein